MTTVTARSRTGITAGQRAPHPAPHAPGHPKGVSDLRKRHFTGSCPSCPSLPHNTLKQPLTCTNTPSAPPWGTQLPQTGHRPTSDLRKHPCPMPHPYGACARAHTHARAYARGPAPQR